MFGKGLGKYLFVGILLVLFLSVFCSQAFAVGSPLGLKADANCSGSSGTVVLKWSPVTVSAGNSVNYSVYYNTTSRSGPWVLAQQVSTPSYTFTGDCSANIYFKVKALEIDSSGNQLAESLDSEVVVAASSGSNIPPPYSIGRGCNLVTPVLTASIDTANSYTQINLSWTDTSCGVIRFDITRSDGWNTRVDAGKTTYCDSGLASATTYRYQVRVRNATGQYEDSNWASATTR